MKKTQCLSLICLLAGSVAAYAQGPAKGDAAKGKATFDQQCGLCHDATTTDKKMGPGFKGLFKRPKLSTTGKPVNDANVTEKINEGGNGMPPFKDTLSAGDKANVIAYLKTLYVPNRMWRAAGTAARCTCNSPNHPLHLTRSTTEINPPDSCRNAADPEHASSAPSAVPACSSALSHLLRSIPEASAAERDPAPVPGN